MKALAKVTAFFFLVSTAHAQNYEQAVSIFTNYCMQDPYGADCSEHLKLIESSRSGRKKNEMNQRLRILLLGAMKEIMPQELSALFYSTDYVEHASKDELEKMNKLSLTGQAQHGFRFHHGYVAVKVGILEDITRCMIPRTRDENGINPEDIFQACRADSFYGTADRTKSPWANKENPAFSKKFSSYSDIIRQTGIYFRFFDGVPELFANEYFYKDVTASKFKMAALNVPERFIERHLFRGTTIRLAELNKLNELNGENLTKDAIWLMGQFRFLVKHYWDLMDLATKGFPEKHHREAFLKWDPKTELAPAIDVRTYIEMVKFFSDEYNRMRSNETSGKMVYSLAMGICDPKDNWTSNRIGLKTCYLNNLDVVLKRVIILHNLLSLSHFLSSNIATADDLNYVIPYIDNEPSSQN